jgi:hypothetical protein
MDKPIIKVQHMEDQPPNHGGKAPLNRKKRNAEQLGVFRAASPVMTSAASGPNDHTLYLALPSARSNVRSLSSASLFNENGVHSGLTDEKLLLK